LLEFSFNYSILGKKSLEVVYQMRLFKAVYFLKCDFP